MAEHRPAVEPKKRKVAEAALDAQKKRNDFMLRYGDVLSFSTPPDNIDPAAREYISIMRQRVFDHLTDFVPLLHEGNPKTPLFPLSSSAQN